MRPFVFAQGVSAVSGKPLSYKGSVFHRVITEFMCQGRRPRMCSFFAGSALSRQGGDFTHANGTGGESIFGKKFAMSRRWHRLGMAHAALLGATRRRWG